MQNASKEKLKFTIEMWDDTTKPDILSLEYPAVGVDLDDMVNIFKTIMLWLTFSYGQIESILDEEYKEE